jgi:hypothetical protein
MSADQVAIAYRRYFGFDAPSRVLTLTNLTPADFATVTRKAAALGEQDQSRLTRWLEQEAMVKPDAQRNKIGF